MSSTTEAEPGPDRVAPAANRAAFIDRGVLAAGFLALNFYSLLTPFGLDQSIVAIIARGIREGQMPYTDLWDHNAPGIFLVYRFAFALFGESEVGLNAFDILYRTATLLAIYSLGRVLLSRPQAVVSAVIYGVASTLHYQVHWFQAQRETFLVLPLTLSCLAIAHHRTRQRALLPCLAGLCWAIAALIKPNTLITLPFYVLFLVAIPREHQPWRRRALDLGGFALATCIAVLPVGVWLAHHGALGAAWEALVPFNLYHAAPPSAFTTAQRLSLVGRGAYILFQQVPFLITSALIGAWFLAVEHPWSDRHYLLVWFVVLLLGVVGQSKLYGYHSILLLPAAALLAGYGLYRFTECLVLPSTSDTR